MVCFTFATRHLIVVCTQTYIFRRCNVFKKVVCRLYEMLYPCSCNVVISCWKSGAYGSVICRGGTDMCFVPGSGWKHLDLEQYRISGITRSTLQSVNWSNKHRCVLSLFYFLHLHYVLF